MSTKILFLEDGEPRNELEKYLYQNLFAVVVVDSTDPHSDVEEGRVCSSFYGKDGEEVLAAQNERGSQEKFFVDKLVPLCGAPFEAKEILSKVRVIQTGESRGDSYLILKAEDSEVTFGDSENLVELWGM